MKTIKVSISLHKDLWVAGVKRAKQRRRTFSGYIQDLVLEGEERYATANPPAK